MKTVIMPTLLNLKAVNHREILCYLKLDLNGLEVKVVIGRIYMKGQRRVVVPFHSGKALHPKIVKQVVKAIETAE